MQHVDIKIVDTPDDAPNYRRDQPHVKAAKLKSAVIVCNGTTTGRPSVDLVFTDDEGNTFVAMTTAGLVDGIAAAARGAVQRGQGG